MKKFLIPLALFLGLVVFLAVGLKRDPREIPSPLIDKPAPAFSLPTLEGSQPFGPQDLKGKVVSTSMNKVCVVAVERLAEHPTYFKRIRLTKRYHAATDVEVAVGDTVLLQGCRPLSKKTRFAVAEVLQKAL